MALSGNTLILHTQASSTVLGTANPHWCLFQLLDNVPTLLYLGVFYCWEGCWCPLVEGVRSVRDLTPPEVVFKENLNSLVPQKGLSKGVSPTDSQSSLVIIGLFNPNCYGWFLFLTSSMSCRCFLYLTDTLIEPTSLLRVSLRGIPNYKKSNNIGSNVELLPLNLLFYLWSFLGSNAFLFRFATTGFWLKL